MTLRAALVDLGNVVIRIDPDRIRTCWAARSEAGSEAVRDAFPDAVYEAYERDEVTEADYLAHVRSRFGLRGTDAELLACFDALFLGVDEQMVEILHGLRDEGLLVVALSNTNRSHHRTWARRYADALRVFHRVHCSHELGARKPEPAAFERVLAAHDLAPEEAVFVDDMPGHVAAAERLGLTGLVFTGADRLSRDLADLELRRARP